MKTPKKTPKVVVPEPKSVMKPRKYARKKFTSNTQKHVGRAVNPQAGIANIPGVDLQRFFSYINFGKAKWLRVMDEKERGLRFNFWIRSIREDFGFPDLHVMADFMGINRHMMDRLAYRHSRPVSLGFVLDICYIFNKDPTEIFPELTWLRDLWMRDHLMLLEAAIASCEAGELKAVRHTLEAMKSSSSIYPFEDSEDPRLNVLMKTKAHVTEMQAWFSENMQDVYRRDRQWHTFTDFGELINQKVDARVTELRKEFDEIQDYFKKGQTGTTPETTD